MPIRVQLVNFPESSNWRVYLPILLALVSGLLLPLGLEWLKRRYFAPKLRLIFDPRVPYILPTRVPGSLPGNHHATYLRVGVVNEGASYAKDVRAYISDVQLKGKNGYEKSPFHVECLRLKWSNESDQADMHAGIDLPGGVEFLFDVLSLKQEASEETLSQEAFEVASKQEGLEEPFRIIQCANMRARFDENLLYNKLQMKNAYQITVFVTAEGVKPQKLSLNVVIGSSYQDLDAFAKR